MGAVLVEGAKWCGKTTTCEQFAKSAVYMADPLKREENLRYFTDPSIAVAALGLSPGRLADDIRSLGYFFEALAIRDLRVYMDAVMGRIERYHDRSGLECDAVLHTRDGSYALVEIKLGGDLVEEGVATLNKLSARLAAKGMKPPVFKMVLTATGDFAYRRREDGVMVCPLSALKA